MWWCLLKDGHFLIIQTQNGRNDCFTNLLILWMTSWNRSGSRFSTNVGNMEHLSELKFFHPQGFARLACALTTNRRLLCRRERKNLSIMHHIIIKSSMLIEDCLSVGTFPCNCTPINSNPPDALLVIPDSYSSLLPATSLSDFNLSAGPSFAFWTTSFSSSSPAILQKPAAQYIQGDDCVLYTTCIWKNLCSKCYILSKWLIDGKELITPTELLSMCFQRYNTIKPQNHSSLQIVLNPCLFSET